jgi:AcrR family transcriptional regulator
VASPRTAALRDEILKVSLELGTELGEEGLTMRGIAARLGVSPTIIYQHFESKTLILREIRFFGMDALGRALAPAQDIREPRACLREMARLYIRFARENPWLYQVLMEREQVDWRDLSPEETAGLLLPLEGVRACLRVGVADGVFRRDLDVESAAFQLWAAVHGLSSLMLTGRISEAHPAMPVRDESRFLEAFVDGIVAGFTA